MLNIEYVINNKYATFIDRIMKLNKNKSEIVKIVSKYFDIVDVSGIMLTGSYADSTNTANSDIDILLLSDTAVRQEIENILYDGHLVQFIILPTYKAYQILYKDYYEQGGVFMSMFRKGLIIYDKKNTLFSFKFFSMNNELPINEYNIINLRRLITSQLDDLEKIEDRKQGLLVVIEIIRALAMLLSGKHKYVGKHLCRELNKSDLDKCYELLINYIASNDELIYRNIKEFLQPYGGFVYKYSSSHTFIDPHKNDMLVFIPSKTSFEKVSIDIASQIITTCNDCVCSLFYIGQNQIMEAGHYVSIYSEKIDMHNIYDRLNSFTVREQKTNSNYFSKISYPYQSCFYEGMYFGGTNIFKSLVPYFSDMSKIVIEIYEENHAEGLNVVKGQMHILSFKILYIFVKIAFETNKERALFVNGCVKTYEAEIIDVNRLHNFNQQRYQQNVNLLRYNKMYIDNRDSLLKIIDSQIIDYDLESLPINIYKIIRDFKIDSFYNEGLFKKPKNAIYFHVISHIFSIFLIHPIEKYSLSFYLYKISEEYDIW